MDINQWDNSYITLGEPAELREQKTLSLLDFLRRLRVRFFRGPSLCEMFILFRLFHYSLHFPMLKWLL